VPPVINDLAADGGTGFSLREPCSASLLGLRTGILQRLPEMTR
jgi:hypothetical protein